MRTTSSPIAPVIASVARASSRLGSSFFTSVELELVLVALLQRRVLVLFPQEAVADGEPLDPGAHEAAERVLGRADDRLAAHVEAGVDDHGAAGPLLVGGNELMKLRVRFLVHRLHPR